MRAFTSSVVAVVLFSVLALFPKVTFAQDPVKLAPDIYNVLLENSRVRVLEIRLAPGGKTPMHSHPGFVIYVLSDGTVKFTYPSGKSEERELKAGEAIWSDAVTNVGENVGTTDIHVLNIELKPHKAAKHAAK